MAKVKPQKLVSYALAQKLTKKACEQYETSLDYKQQRMNDIQASVDLYDNKVKPAGRGRFNVPVPVMSGFVDTLMSKIDEGIKLTFKYTNIANLIKVKKILATWEKESSPSRGKWDRVDRAVKKNAIFSGVGIYEQYAESDPEYKSHFRGVHYLDFHCEPLGGQDLTKHLFCGVEGVFKTKKELLAGAKDGSYYEEGVSDVVSKTSEDDRKKNTDIYKNKIALYSNLGLDPDSHSYTGEPSYSFNKWVLTHEGEKYYLVFDWITKKPIRCLKLKSLSKSGRLPWTAWHTHSDLLNFWSKAPADDVRPVAESINVLFNQALDNRQKRNFGMRAVDPEIFPDLEQLEWRPDGLVVANTAMGTKAIGSGLYEFKTEEVGGTIDLIDWMNKILGQMSGITADTQGESDEDKVGIYYGNLQQVADRLGLYNKSYVEGHVENGLIFQEGIRMHMTEGYMVKLIGEDGAVSEGEVERDDAVPEGQDGEDFDVDVVGGQAEIRANEIKKKNRKDALVAILGNMNLAPKINPNWAIKEILITSDYEKEEVQMALDVSYDGSTEQIARASSAIQKILANGKPKLVRTADTTFVQKIIDYAIDEVEDQKTFDTLMAYAEAHTEFVVTNMQRKARVASLTNAIAARNPENPDTGALPNTKGGTASRSAEITNEITPGSPDSLPIGN